MKKVSLFIWLAVLYYAPLSAQIYVQQGGTLFLDKNVSVYVQGNIDSYADVLGIGTIVLNGQNQQLINLNTYKIPSLQISSTVPAQLTGDLSIESSLDLSGGNLQLNDHKLTLSGKAVVTGDANSYVVNSKNGIVRKYVSALCHDYYLPIGTVNHFMPITFQYHGKEENGFLEIQAVEKPSMHKNPDVPDFIATHWYIRKNGLNGSLVANARINEKNAVVGNIRRIKPFYWNGNTWISQNNDSSPAGSFTAAITANEGELFAMGSRMNAQVKVLSNPVRSQAILQFDLEYDDQFAITLRDITGKPLQQLMFNLSIGQTNKVITLDRYAAGVYVIDVASKDYNKTIKIIKQ